MNGLAYTLIWSVIPLFFSSTENVQYLTLRLYCCWAQECPDAYNSPHLTTSVVDSEKRINIAMENIAANKAAMVCNFSANKIILTEISVFREENPPRMCLIQGTKPTPAQITSISAKTKTFASLVPVTQNTSANARVRNNGLSVDVVRMTSYIEWINFNVSF